MTPHTYERVHAVAVKPYPVKRSGTTARHPAKHHTLMFPPAPRCFLLHAARGCRPDGAALGRLCASGAAGAAAARGVLSHGLGWLAAGRGVAVKLGSRRRVRAPPAPRAEAPPRPGCSASRSRGSRASSRPSRPGADPLNGRRAPPRLLPASAAAAAARPATPQTPGGGSSGGIAAAAAA